MTEAQWLACDDPTLMLRWLNPRSRTKNRYRHRTALLFGVACFARVVDARENSVNWLLRRAEELADGVRDTEPHITRAHADIVERMPAFRSLRLLLEPQDRLNPTVIANDVAWGAAYQFNPAASDQSERSFRAERVAQSHILRELVGNPFRRASVHVAWLTPDVLALARSVYEWNAFDRMPILADALQDAGCDSADVLDHCRGPGPHVRGCWVVDLVLGKE